MFEIKNAPPGILKMVDKYTPWQYYRLVDINTYFVYDYQSELKPTNERCYNAWQRKGPCYNCSSRLAINSDQPILKIEQLANSILFVTSLPIIIAGKKMVLELLQDVTHSLLSNDTNNQLGNVIISNLIDKFNDAVIRDSLTGLFNKRFVEQELSKAIEINRSTGTPFSVAFIDIDKLKQVNDVYGHLMGDQVITTLAELMKKQSLAEQAFACRMGGDEYIMIYPETHLNQSIASMDKLLNNFEAVKFGKAKKRFRSSFSYGLLEYQPEYGSWCDFIDKLDKIMYVNKKKRKRRLSK